MTLVADRIAQLRAAIAAQDQLRPALGDATVDAAVSVLRAQLDALIATESGAAAPARTEEEALGALQARVPAALADKARRTEADRARTSREAGDFAAIKHAQDFLRGQNALRLVEFSRGYSHW